MKHSVVFIALVLVSLLAGGTAGRVLSQPSASQMSQTFERGDLIEIITKDQKYFHVEYLSQDTNTVSGRSDGEVIKVATSDIKEIRYRSISAGRTISGIVLGAIAVIGLGAIIVFSAL